eukprot:scaffold18027_cov77-Skeletonema_dohrnii-CCMP3373.AAC.1
MLIRSGGIENCFSVPASVSRYVAAKNGELLGEPCKYIRELALSSIENKSRVHSRRPAAKDKKRANRREDPVMLCPKCYAPKCQSRVLLWRAGSK